MIFIVANQTVLFAEENPFFAKFPFKEGVIHYAIRGSITGAKLLYFKSYGRQQLIVTQKRGGILDRNKVEKRIILIDSGEKYLIDPEEGKTEKSYTLSEMLYRKFLKLTKKEQQRILDNLKQLPNRSYRNLKSDCIFKAKRVAGIWCNEEQIDGKRECSIAHGALILDATINILGYHVKEFATKIEEKELDDSLFTLPDNLKFTTATEDLPGDAELILRQLLDANSSFACRHRQTNTGEHEELHRLIYSEIQTLSKNF